MREDTLCRVSNYRPDRRPLAEALTLIRDKGGEIIEKLYGKDVRTRFLRRHGKAFREDNFNCKTGLTIHERLSQPRAAFMRRASSLRLSAAASLS